MEPTTLQLEFNGKTYEGSWSDDGKNLVVTCAYGRNTTHSTPLPPSRIPGQNKPPPMAYTLFHELLTEAMKNGKL